MRPQKIILNHALYVTLECISEHKTYYSPEGIWNMWQHLQDTVRGRKYLGQISLDLTQTDSKLIFFHTLYFPHISMHIPFIQ